jgi:diguanylate cyclase (GGDEF)-like protein/PAS domain S-box-containing protein
MTGKAQAAERVSAVQDLIAGHAGAVLVAMDDDGLITPMPPGAPFAAGPAVRARWFIEMVVAGSRAAIVTAWDVVRARGISECSVEFRNGMCAQIHWFDVRNDHGVYLAVVVGHDGRTIDLGTVGEAGDISPRYGVAKRNTAGNVIEVDAAVAHLVGWSGEELIAAQTLDLIHPDDRDRAIDNWLETLAEPSRETRWRGRHLRSDGEYVWLEFTNRNLIDDAAYLGVRSEMLDISDQMAMHEELRKSEARFRTLTEALPLGLAQIDDNGRVLYANRPFTDIVGVEDAATIGDAFAATVPDDRRCLQDAVDSVLTLGADSDLEVSLHSPGATPRVVQIVLRPLHQDSATAAHAIVVVADVTERTSMRHELECRASFDAVTHSYNRSTILAFLESHLASERPPDTGTAVIFVDLDRFKPINDTLGHAAGDEVLALVAQRMRSAVRDQDLVGRIGGDEFLIVCPNVADRSYVTEIAERIATRLQDECLIHADRVSITASIGIAWADTSDTDADALVSRADAAMYEVKRQTKDIPGESAQRIAG